MPAHRDWVLKACRLAFHVGSSPRLFVATGRGSGPIMKSDPSRPEEAGNGWGLLLDCPHGNFPIAPMRANRTGILSAGRKRAAN